MQIQSPNDKTDTESNDGQLQEPPEEAEREEIAEQETQAPTTRAGRHVRPPQWHLIYEIGLSSAEEKYYQMMESTAETEAKTEVGVSFVGTDIAIPPYAVSCVGAGLNGRPTGRRENHDINGTLRVRFTARGHAQADVKHYGKDDITAPVVADMPIRAVMVLIIMAC